MSSHVSKKKRHHREDQWTEWSDWEWNETLGCQQCYQKNLSTGQTKYEYGPVMSRISPRGDETYGDDLGGNASGETSRNENNYTTGNINAPSVTSNYNGQIPSAPSYPNQLNNVEDQAKKTLHPPQITYSSSLPRAFSRGVSQESQQYYYPQSTGSSSLNQPLSPSSSSFYDKPDPSNPVTTLNSLQQTSQSSFEVTYATQKILEEGPHSLANTGVTPHLQAPPEEPPDDATEDYMVDKMSELELNSSTRRKSRSYHKKSGSSKNRRSNFSVAKSESRYVSRPTAREQMNERSSDMPDLSNRQPSNPFPNQPAAMDSNAELPASKMSFSNYPHNKSDLLSSGYRVQPSGKFLEGRVLKVLWSEPHGDRNVQPNADDKDLSEGTWIEGSKYGQTAYHSIRRFVIVKTTLGSSLCLPIMTYGRNATAKSGVEPNDHAIIYTTDEAPKEMPGEKKLRKEAIRVIPWSPRHKLVPESRLNYAKIYTVEHNLKVWFIGEIHSESEGRFFTTWRSTLP